MATLASPFETTAPRTGFSRHDSRVIAKSAQRFRGALTYDVKGNLVTRPASLQSPALSLVWDFDNKLKGADTNGTPASLEVTYEYDALGRRVARSGPGGNVVYFQAGQQTIADYPRGGVPASAMYRYVYGSYIDEPLLRETVSGSVRHFFHRNQQYSVTALNDSAGNTVERYAYTAYVALTVFNSSGTPQATSPLNIRYTYTGREWDDSTKLYHFRARWYDSASGRFVGRDPLGFVDGMGLYAGYFGLDKVDPAGQDIWVVVRQFEADNPKGREHYSWWYRKAGLAHCYIRIKHDDGKVETFSFHPNSWADTVFDANWRRPGRVWHNCETDLMIKRKFKQGTFELVEIKAGKGRELELSKAILEWIKKNQVGYELGGPRVDLECLPFLGPGDMRV